MPTPTPTIDCGPETCIKSLISLLVVVLVVYALSRWLIQAQPERVARDTATPQRSTSDAVRNQLEKATGDYQQKLDNALDSAGAGDQ